jgi:hypothetical protein
MDFPKTKKVLNQFAKAVIKSGKARLSASKMGNSRLIKNFGYHLDQIKRR